MLIHTKYLLSHYPYSPIPEDNHGSLANSLSIIHYIELQICSPAYSIRFPKTVQTIILISFMNE